MILLINSKKNFGVQPAIDTKAITEEYEGNTISLRKTTKIYVTGNIIREAPTG
jgi:hypothetical protein